jgi:hypothetical protein
MDYFLIFKKIDSMFDKINSVTISIVCFYDGEMEINLFVNDYEDAIYVDSNFNIVEIKEQTIKLAEIIFNKYSIVAEVKFNLFAGATIEDMVKNY